MAEPLESKHFAAEFLAEEKHAVLELPPSAPFKDLGAFKEHAILNMSLAQSRSTPMSELVRLYRRTDGPKTCERDFGNGLLDYWRG